MKKFPSLESAQAVWRQPRATAQHFELLYGDDLLATLVFRSSFGTLATAQTTSGSWTFKRVGFLNPRITIRPEGSATEVAIYHPKFWSGGTLALSSGRSIEWKPLNFWMTHWAFLNPLL